MQKTLKEILENFTVPCCGYAPKMVQVFYAHGGLTFKQAREIFSNLSDYAIDGTGSGPSFFLREK